MRGEYTAGGCRRLKARGFGLWDLGFERIREVYPWDAGSFVSSHNDPNPRNILFDGTRLWLVDWETAGRNDPFIDVAILVDSLAPTPDLRDALLRAWLGRTPDRATHARLVLARQITRLYDAALLFSLRTLAPGAAPPDADLSAPSPAELHAAVAAGRLSATGPDMLYTLGKMCLERFRRDLGTAEFAESLDIARAGWGTCLP
jgi:hypothetical protein